MDHLSETQKATVKKSSSDRLRLRLLKAGFLEEVVLSWSREELMEKYAELILKGIDIEGEAQVVSPEIERERWQHEQKMKEMELESERLRLEAEERREKERMEVERERQLVEDRRASAEREAHERVELERLALERMRIQMDREVRLEEARIKEATEADESAQLKRYGQALMHILSPQPEEITDVPSWFRGVEDQFDKLKVPRIFRARLLQKYLSPRSRTLCARLDPQIRDDYFRMKQTLLKDLGLSAKTFLEKFNRVKKGTADTFVLYASKLESLLRQYLDARKIDNDFGELINLLLSDRIKSELSESCLKHIISLESSLSEGEWLKPTRLATVVDEYISNLGTSTRITSSFLGQATEMRRTPAANVVSVKSDRNHDPLEHKIWTNNSSKPRFNPVNSKFENGRACFLCGSHFHLKANCDKKRFSSPKRVNFAQHSKYDQGQRSAAAAVEPVAAAVTQAEASNVQANVNKVVVGSRQLSEYEDIFSLFEPVDDSVCAKEFHYGGTQVTQSQVKFDTHRIVAETNAALHYVDVRVSDSAGNEIAINSLFDSGTELSILRTDVLGGLQYKSLGEIVLRAFDGHRSNAQIVSLDVKLTNAQKTVPVKFALCDNVSHACLLSLSDYRRLLEQSTDHDNKHDMSIHTCSDEHCSINTDFALSGDIDNDNSQLTSSADVTQEVGEDQDADSDNIIDGGGNHASRFEGVLVVAPQDLANPPTSNVDKLVEEQMADKSLSGAFRLAKENKGGYFVRDKLLFH